LTEEPIRSGYVSLSGWTNVGKSTLLNQLVGAKLAAVADVAQTTRQRITGVLSLPGRGQIVFVDTPGLHRPKHRMNRAMVQLARETMRGVDLALWIVDASRGIGPGDLEAAELVRRAGVPRIAVLNKVDLVHPKSRLLPLLEQAVGPLDFSEVVPISARSGNGCDALLEVILRQLPEGPPLFPDDYLTDQPERALAAEWVREKLLARTRQELPHASAVTVEQWREREDGLLEIEATIYVDRESQKKIVIGKQGGLLKEIGSEARVELEEFLERRVFLRLWVKVREGWRDDRILLRELGLD